MDMICKGEMNGCPYYVNLNMSWLTAVSLLFHLCPSFMMANSLTFQFDLFL